MKDGCYEECKDLREETYLNTTESRQMEWHTDRAKRVLATGQQKSFGFVLQAWDAGSFILSDIDITMLCYW